MKKTKPATLALPELRDRCGTYVPWNKALAGLKQYSPGRWRKTYRSNAPKGRWFYIPAVLEPREMRRPLAEIAAQLDRRPLDELWSQATDALGQMLSRAYCGDDVALARYVRLIYGEVGSLSNLARYEQARVRAKAETFSQWPVLLSLNPQDSSRVNEQLEALAVGSKATIRTGRGQRTDPCNFWTRLAEYALTACWENRALVPILKAHCKNCYKRVSQSRKFWGTKTSTTYYYLHNGDAIILTDWQTKCDKLTEPITAENFSEWWDAVRLCVLHHWKNKAGRQADTLSYAHALKEIGSLADDEWRRRNLALKQTKQALRSLTLPRPH